MWPYLPSVIMENVQSLIKKMDEICANLRYFHDFRIINPFRTASVMSFVETWLCNSHNDSLAAVDGFKLISGDRMEDSGKTGNYCGNFLTSSIRSQPQRRQTTHELCEIIDNIETFSPDAKRDFNYRSLKKSTFKYHQHVTCSTRENLTLDMFYSNVKDAYTSIQSPKLGNADHNLVNMLPKYRPLVQRRKTNMISIQKWNEDLPKQLQT